MTWKFFLRYQLGFPETQAIEVTPEELPGEAELAGDNLVAMAMTRNAGLQLAESDVRAKEFRLKGEKRGYLPTLELVSVYSVLAQFNNYSQFFRTFQRNNFNAGIDVHMPIFSAQTRAAIGLAQINLEAAQVNLTNKKTELSADVRQRHGGCGRGMRRKKWRGWNCSWRNKTWQCFNRNSPKES